MGSPLLLLRMLISIHASRGGSDDIHVTQLIGSCDISIHASRGGSDCRHRSHKPFPLYFNPRFPRGKRPLIRVGSFTPTEFQSTLPAGEATTHAFRSPDWRIYFNPRFPRGKRQSSGILSSGSTLFQSTLPAGEATSGLPASPSADAYFNPRFPRGKRLSNAYTAGEGKDFNPRFPRGKRPAAM